MEQKTKDKISISQKKRYQNIKSMLMERMNLDTDNDDIYQVQANVATTLFTLMELLYEWLVRKDNYNHNVHAAKKILITNEQKERMFNENRRNN